MVVTNQILEVRVRHRAHTTLVELVGELDYLSAPDLANAFGSIQDKGDHRIELDCRGLKFVDSEGIKTILRARHQLIEKGGRLRITGCNNNILRVLQILGISNLVSGSLEA